MTKWAISRLVFLPLLVVAVVVIASAALHFDSPQWAGAAISTQPLASCDRPGCEPLTSRASVPTNTSPATSRPLTQVLPVATPVVRALPTAGSGPEDGSFPWVGVLGGLLAATGLVLVFSGLHGGLSDSEP
jgi:hypothetical protein